MQRDSEILIAVNNTFAGSGNTYDDQGSLSVMLDPRRFKHGANEIAAYILVANELSLIETSR